MVMKAKRKLSTKQKKVLTKRLEKARAAKSPPKYAQYHQDVVNLPEDHPLAFNKVRGWLKNAKSRAQSERRDWNHNKTKGALARSTTWASYASQCEAYLRGGEWISLFQGENMEKKVKYKCVAMAYHTQDSIWKGKPKRTIGVWYPDCGAEWTYEMEETERKAYGVKEKVYKPKKRKTKKKKA
tara:strand:- start:234 stop:782 length:549 start_codon:yes stop_codon:yes gene_type:complete